MRLFYFFIILLLVAGCRKSDKPFQSNINMTLDGDKINFSRDIYASSSSSPILDIYGYGSVASGDGNFSINLYNFDNKIGVKSFGNLGAIGLAIKRSIGGGGQISETYSASGSDAKLTILEIDDKYIKGTFEAVVTSQATAISPSVTKYITNGEFRILRAR